MIARLRRLVGDLADRNGEVTDEGESIVRLGATTVAAGVAGLLPLLDISQRLASYFPAAFRVVALALPCVLLAGCLHYVSAVRSRPDSPLHLPLDTATRRPFYAFSRTRRRAAKWLLLPLSVAMAATLFEYGPNVLWTREVVAGYACNALTGAPLAGAAVAVLASDGAAGERRLTDDTGYFALRLDDWAARPKRLALSSGRCKTVGDLSVAQAQRTRSGCPTESGELPVRRADTRTWLFTCQ